MGRQYLGGTLRHKQLLLLWSGRTLRRCFVAWGAHLVRTRMEREVRDELRQLSYALRVATLSSNSSVLERYGLTPRDLARRAITRLPSILAFSVHSGPPVPRRAAFRDSPHVCELLRVGAIAFLAGSAGPAWRTITSASGRKLATLPS